MKLLRHDLVRRSALFASSIIASTVVGIFSIPILVSQVGAATWGVLAVLQIVGQFFAVGTAFGWGATGPSMVSGAVIEERKSIFVDSLIVRACLFLVLGPAAEIFGAVLTGVGLDLALLAAVTYVAPGLSAAWYFIGSNRPAALFLLDALPAILGQVTGLIAVLLAPDLRSYLMSTAAWAVVGVVSSAIFVLSRHRDGPRRLPHRVPWRRLIHSQLGGVLSMLSASVWSAAPTILVQSFAPQNIPAFAIIDRLLKYGVLALAPVLQAVQSWVPEAGRQALGARAKRAVTISLGLGPIGGVLLLACGPLAANILTLGEVALPWYVAALAGAVFACECVSQITGLSSLVALGGTRQLAFSSVAATLAGLAITAAAVWWFGVAGAVAGMLVVAAWSALYRVRWVRLLSSNARPLSEAA